MTNSKTANEMANAIRSLSMDAVEKANSGHPGLPMGCADVAFTQQTKTATAGVYALSGYDLITSVEPVDGDNSVCAVTFSEPYAPWGDLFGGGLEFFLKAAAELPGVRCLLGGSGLEDKPLTPNVKYLGHVYTRDHNAFNCTPLAVLNISRESMARYGFSPATRVFEAAGAGACLITDEWVGIEMFLEPGREVLVARDGAQVAEHLRDLTPERARRIGEAARRRVLAEHTYAHRAAQLEAVLDAKIAGPAEVEA